MVVAQRLNTFKGQHGEHQPYRATNHVDGFGLKAGKHYGHQHRHCHRPQVAAIQHKRVLHPHRGEFGGIQQERKHQRHPRQAERAAPAQHGPQGCNPQAHVADHAQHLGKSHVRQGERWAHVHRHPHHVGRKPKKAVGEEERCLVQNAERVHALGDSRAQAFKLLGKIQRALVKEFADEIAIDAKKDHCRHCDEGGGCAGNGGNGFPARAAHMDVKGNGHRGHHDRMLLRQHGSHIAQQRQPIPRHPAP